MHNPNMHPILQGLLRQAVSIQSPSGKERVFAQFLKETMESLEYDQVYIDVVGNVVGRVGHGTHALVFDGNMDTVLAEDLEKWHHPPYNGVIENGALYGRGSADMKGGLLCAVYAAAMARKTLADDHCIYVTATVEEEYADGQSLRFLLENLPVRPEGVVVCKPSNNQVMLGHYGRALVEIQVEGRSAHGSEPQAGLNAIYQASPIIDDIATLADTIAQEGSGTLTLSRIESQAASLNAVPHGCKLVLDWRLSFGANQQEVSAHLDKLVDERQATWRILPQDRTTWTGAKLDYEPLHAPWHIEETATLTNLMAQAYQQYFGNPCTFAHWQFSTNAVAPVSMGIPTIGFGPGDPKQSHMPNEHCSIHQLWDACQYYLNIMTAFGR